MSEPTYDNQSGQKLVYKTHMIWDDSGLLRVKNIYELFHLPALITSVMVFERRKGNKTDVSDYQYYALVYARGLVQPLR